MVKRSSTFDRQIDRSPFVKLSKREDWFKISSLLTVVSLVKSIQVKRGRFYRRTIDFTRVYVGLLSQRFYQSTLRLTISVSVVLLMVPVQSKDSCSNKSQNSEFRNKTKV